MPEQRPRRRDSEVLLVYSRGRLALGEQQWAAFMELQCSDRSRFHNDPKRNSRCQSKTLPVKEGSRLKMPKT